MTRAVLLVALAVASVACGVKSHTLPPELVQPLAPSELAAKSLTDGVHLIWRRPTAYSGGQHMRDLGGFEIERGSGVDGLDWTRVGTVELTDQTRFRQEPMVDWTDTTAVAGATYRYRIIAYTLDGYRSRPSGPLTVEHRVPPAQPKTPADQDR